MARDPTLSLDDLIQWLKAEFDLVPEPPHGGTWRNMFYKTVDRHPATTTRVLKILADANGTPQKLQPCSASDNNNSILVDIPMDLNLLRPLVENEIHLLTKRLSH